MPTVVLSYIHGWTFVVFPTKLSRVLGESANSQECPCQVYFKLDSECRTANPSYYSRQHGMLIYVENVGFRVRVGAYM